MGLIDLAALEPFEAVEAELPIMHEKGGEKGSMQIRMLFQPESKQSTVPG